ncbi:MAG: NRDE family protein, partial [Desulfobacterales bacterium]
SRGSLVSDYLTGNSPPVQYLKAISKISRTYNGFNLIVGDGSELYYYSNRAKGIRKLKPDFYGISNHLLDTDWPKVRKSKAQLRAQLMGKEQVEIEKIWRVLADRSPALDTELPDTGVGLQWERILSPMFINSQDYGTRSSSIVLIEKSGRLVIMERTFLNSGNVIKQGATRHYSFKIRH